MLLKKKLSIQDFDFASEESDTYGLLVDVSSAREDDVRVPSNLRQKKLTSG